LAPEVTVKRSKFFASAALIGASATVGGAATTMGLAADAGHHFLSSMPDVEGRRVFVGYPDECHDFTLFAGALAALITDGEWSINPWALYADLAIAIDFVSETRMVWGLGTTDGLCKHDSEPSRDKRTECQVRQAFDTCGDRAKNA